MLCCCCAAAVACVYFYPNTCMHDVMHILLKWYKYSGCNLRRSFDLAFAPRWNNRLYFGPLSQVVSYRTFLNSCIDSDKWTASIYSRHYIYILLQCDNYLLFPQIMEAHFNITISYLSVREKCCSFIAFMRFGWYQKKYHR